MKTPDIYVLLQNSILNETALINPYLQDPPKGCVADRVAIYTDGFYGRLEEALLSDYVTLAAIMGEEAFSTLCQAYIKAHPSVSYSLNFLGQNLSPFLNTTWPYSKKPYLAEIAAFEWAESQAIVAADSHLLSAADLQSIPVDQWPEIIFYLHPSCKIIKTYWNSVALINASRSDEAIPGAKKLKTSQAVMVWRRERDVRYGTLEGVELIMLNLINQHASFIEICDHLGKVMPEDKVADYLVQELYAWLQEQIFILKVI